MSHITTPTNYELGDHGLVFEMSAGGRFLLKIQRSLNSKAQKDTRPDNTMG